MAAKLNCDLDHLEHCSQFLAGYRQKVWYTNNNNNNKKQISYFHPRKTVQIQAD